MSSFKLVLRAEQVGEEQFRFELKREHPELPQVEWGIVARISEDAQGELRFLMMEMHGMEYGGAGTGMEEAIAFAENYLGVHEDERKAA